MIEKAGVLYLRFFCYLYVLFSFVLIQKKKYQKEKIKAASARLLRSHPRRQEGQKLASLKQSALLDAGNKTYA